MTGTVPARMSTSEQDDDHGGWRDRVADAALNGFIGMLSLIPRRSRLAVAGWLLRRVIGPALGWYGRVDANIQHVWPDTPPDERRAIASAAIDNLGCALIENYDPRGILARGKAATLSGPGLAAFEAARAEGRAVLLISGHYGSPIIPRAALIARGHQVAGILRAMSNPFSNARYVQNYRDVGEPVFVQSRRGTIGFVKHLRAGGIAMMVHDVFDSSGAPIDFLGQPAPTSLAPAEIALKTDALFLPYFGIRAANRYDIDIVLEAPIPHGTPLQMMQEATARLEARVIADPGQWMWTHRRWKPKRQAKRQRKRAAASMGP